MVYKKSFEQWDSMGTGTASDADWACQGDEENVHFFQIEVGELQVWVYKKALSNGIPWAQARLQMQIGHARATRKNVQFCQMLERECPAWDKHDFR